MQNIHATETPTAPVADGFTLIELLVVVTIIVVLLALLTPALDKAIYQAELAVCATKLDGVANGAILYTQDFRRAYPYRYARLSSTIPTYLFREAVRDEQKMIERYIPINKMLNDPLSKAVDFEGAARIGSIYDRNYTYASYTLWYGWQYWGKKAMSRLGDRWEWNTQFFDILAGDQKAQVVGSWGQGSHPDGDNVWFNEVLEDKSPPVTQTIPTDRMTRSYWVDRQAVPGPVDLNYAFQDGSVQRFNGVKPTDGDPGKSDRQIARVPYTSGDNLLTWVFQVPQPR